jgi:hypothetical protein
VLGAGVEPGGCFEGGALTGGGGIVTFAAIPVVLMGPMILGPIAPPPPVGTSGSRPSA